jgi:uncharacterized protein (TIGR02145 family)
MTAQSPQGIPYQAVVRATDGSVLSNTSVSLTFKVHDGSPTGAVVYQETHALTSSAQGVVHCTVGNGSPVSGSFSAIPWENGSKFLHVINGVVDMGTQQMMSVPYALYTSSTPVSVSVTGDTLTIGKHTMIVPGVSAANTVLGCTDASACNYNALANQNDNSCLYLNASCNDGNSSTYADVINSSCQCVGTPLINGLYYPGAGVTDVDGNTYTSVVINGQEWMQQNLAVSKYNNGDLIPVVIADASWQSSTTGAYSIYNNTGSNNTTYGKIYNGFAVVDNRGLCPTGWHVPTDAEWTLLENFLGGSTVAGGKLKALTTWNSPNTSATNSSGWTGLGGGYRTSVGNFFSQGNFGYWWSSSFDISNNGQYRRLDYNNAVVTHNSVNKQYGFSVRCLHD